MKHIWYFLDPDNNKDEPKGMFCARCKRGLKETQSVESFSSIVIHPEHPWFRLAKPDEKSNGMIGSRCLKICKQFGEQKP